MEDVTLRVLLIDDDEDDYIVTRDLFSDIEAGKFELEWIAQYDEALEAIKLAEHDVYLIDYRLGQHDGLDLLRDATEAGCTLPIIFLTGQGDRDVDIRAMEAGASDYLSKARVDADLLERSIRYSIDRKRAENERERLIEELREAMAEIKTLGGMLPMCSACKKIRDDNGYWNAVELYITNHSNAEFSHSICPPCVQELYPDTKLAKSTNRIETH